LRKKGTKRHKKAEKGARIDIPTTHRIAAGMTATKYNSKHRIVDEDVKKRASVAIGFPVLSYRPFFWGLGWGWV